MTLADVTNIICDHADSLEDALDGLKAHYEDQHATIRERFAGTGSVQ